MTTVTLADSVSVITENTNTTLMAGTWLHDLSPKGETEAEMKLLGG